MNPHNVPLSALSLLMPEALYTHPVNHRRVAFGYGRLSGFKRRQVSDSPMPSP